MRECYINGLSLRICSDKTLYTKKTTIWNNQDIKIDNKTIFFRTWFDKGVHTVKDLVDQNLDSLTYEEFQLRYHLQTNFLTYYELINAIPQEYKKAIKQTGVLQEHLTQPWENLKVLTAKVIHKSFVKHMFEGPTVKQRLITNGLPPDQISKYFNLVLRTSFWNRTCALLGTTFNDWNIVSVFE